jgi:hypothetical protein
MCGSFSKVDDETLGYPDYVDPSVQYTDTIVRANEILRSSYSNTTHTIQGWRPFDIQFALHGQAKETKIRSLNNLNDSSRAQLENIRLYDFIKGINMVLPDTAMEQIKNCKSEAEYNELLKTDYFMGLNDEGDRVKKHRLALGTAMRLGQLDALLEAYKQPIYFTGTGFLSLDAHIARSISLIEKEEMEDLLDNQSRAQAECCIC